MFVGRFGFFGIGGDGVDVDVENIVRNEGDVRDSGFLLQFAQGDISDVCFSVGMTAEADPFVQRAMMVHQYFRSVAADKQCGARDMAGIEVIAIEAAGRGMDQINNAQCRCLLGFMLRGVAFQSRDQAGSRVQPPLALA